MKRLNHTSNDFPKAKEKVVGRFAVPIEVASYFDLMLVERKQLEPQKVRRLVIQGLADSGSNKLILPPAVAKQLGLVESSKVKVSYGHGRSVLRSQVEGVHVTVAGRGGVFSAVLEPSRDTALIGAIVMEDLDLLIDCGNQRLVPRDPKYVINEVGCLDVED